MFLEENADGIIETIITIIVAIIIIGFDLGILAKLNPRNAKTLSKP